MSTSSKGSARLATLAYFSAWVWVVATTADPLLLIWSSAITQQPQLQIPAI